MERHHYYECCSSNCRSVYGRSVHGGSVYGTFLVGRARDNWRHDDSALG